jgi:predicted Zn-dependent protease
MAEEEAGGKSTKSIFFATHPSTAERLATLKVLADKASKEQGSWTKGREEYLAATKPFQREWLREEVQKGNYDASRVALSRLLESGSDSAEIHFFLGEVYRLRGEKEDCDSACSEYWKALELGNPPPEIYKSLGLVYWRTGRTKEACDSFMEYLKAIPDASDRQIIESYVNRLR